MHLGHVLGAQFYSPVGAPVALQPPKNYSAQSARLLGFCRNENCENPRRLNSVLKTTLFNLRGFSLFSTLFSLGDLASPLFNSELRSVILFGNNPVASSLSYSDGVRSPILNRALARIRSPKMNSARNSSLPCRIAECLTMLHQTTCRLTHHHRYDHI